MVEDGEDWPGLQTKKNHLGYTDLLATDTCTLSDYDIKTTIYIG